MENASKALTMAGGVLIGILIISLAVYLFADFGTTSAEINKENAERQLEQFNTQFSTYLNRTNITGYELVSVVNLAKENNRQYEGTNNYESESNGYKIDIKVGNTTIIGLSIDELERSYIKIDDYGQPQLYTCNGIDYDSQNGRVRVVYFKITE